MKSNSLIRTIYLYLFTIVGLALVVIGSVRFIDMALKIFVFKQADAPQILQQKFSCQSYAPFPVSKLESVANQNTANSGLTSEEQTALKSFLDNYQKCQQEGANINYVTSQRQRDSSISLAMILVGLPLYLYHWLTIKRETKKDLVVSPDVPEA